MPWASPKIFLSWSPCGPQGVEVEVVVCCFGLKRLPIWEIQFENQVALACGEVGKDKLKVEPEQSGEALELGVVGRNEGVERPAVEPLNGFPILGDLTPYSARPR